MFLRLFFALLLAIAVTGVLFFSLSQMIAPKESSTLSKTAPLQFDFIRHKESSELKRKSRPKPKKPKIAPEPKVEKLAIKNSVQEKFKNSPKMSLDLPKMNFSLSGDTFLGNAFVGSGITDMALIPLVQIPPRYPKKAKRLKKEGYVKVLLKISAQGLVREAQILEAKPKGYFEKEALRAVKKYKYKPKIENGVAVANEGEQIIEFKL
jgi:periplasmic protein TonB